jgi:hypothetical protein
MNTGLQAFNALQFGGTHTKCRLVAPTNRGTEGFLAA